MLFIIFLKGKSLVQGNIGITANGQVWWMRRKGMHTCHLLSPTGGGHINTLHLASWRQKLLSLSKDISWWEIPAI